MITRRVRLATALFLAALGITGCQSGASSDPQGQRREPSGSRPISADGMYRSRADSVGTLARQATLVIQGTVDKVLPGTPPAANAHDRFESNLLEVKVERVIRGATLSMVRFEQLAKLNGEPIDLDGQRILGVGDRGIFFLAPMAARPGTFELFNNQSIYVTINDRLTGSDPADPLVTELNGLTLAQLVARIEAEL